MTHSGNNKWYGEHEQSTSTVDKKRGVIFCSNVLFGDKLKGKELESSSRNSYWQWDCKSIVSHLHTLFTKGKVNINLYCTHFPGNVCRGLLKMSGKLIYKDEEKLTVVHLIK
jgi:hypothetical protein